MENVSSSWNEQGGFAKTSRNNIKYYDKIEKSEYLAMPILDKHCKTLGTDYWEIMKCVPYDTVNTNDE